MLDRQTSETLQAMWLSMLRDAYLSLQQLRGPRIFRKKDEERDRDRFLSLWKVDGGPPIILSSIDDWVIGLLQGRFTEYPGDKFLLAFAEPLSSLLQKGEKALTIEDRDHISAILRPFRSLLVFFKKLEGPIDPDKAKSRIDSYLEIEESLPDYRTAGFDTNVLDDMVSRVIAYVLAGYQPRIERARHGPGAVADKKMHNEKFNFSVLYSDLNRHWPYYDWIFGGVYSTPPSSHLHTKGQRQINLAKLASHYKSLTRLEFATSRMILVPKDIRGPRIISAEPSELMFIQQGLVTHLQDFLEKRSPVRGHIGFADQSVNATLAITGSATGTLSTLDLSDASDRVALSHVIRLFPENCDSLISARSRATILPDGRVITLKKFAPMGSALCFPVESIFFFSICVATIVQLMWDDRDGLLAQIERAVRCVHVYGDDIIVDSIYAWAVVDALESYDLRVNKNKSFFGPRPGFRESCGSDAYCGRIVTPFKLKKLPPSRPRDGDAMKAYTDYASIAYSLGFKTLGDCIRTHLGKVLRAPVPFVPYEMGYVSIVRNDITINHCISSHGVSLPGPRGYLRSKQFVYRAARTESLVSPEWRLRSHLSGATSRDPSRVVARSATQISKRSTDMYFA